MEDVLLYTGVYGIIIMVFMNLSVIFIAWNRKILDWQELLWLFLLIVGIALIAGTIFFRKVNNMDWQYNVAILASLIGLIAIFLRMTKKLVRKPGGR